VGEGTGFGKTIFIGDAFIQFGVPAVVAALGQRTHASVRASGGSGWSLEDSRPEVAGYKESKRSMQGESVERILRAMGLHTEDRRISIVLGGDLLAGSGIGASAAGCVALARALSAEFGLGLDDDRINRIAFEGEKAYHGEPGGVDNTASTYGGVLWFEKDLSRGIDVVERIGVLRPLHVVLANSGVHVDTSEVVAYKKALVAAEPARFESLFRDLRRQAVALREGIEAGRIHDVGAVMNEHHEILRSLDFSHERIEELVRTARGQGALGAKVTGGGRGGFMLALAGDEDAQARVGAAIQALGFMTLTTTVGA